MKFFYVIITLLCLSITNFSYGQKTHFDNKPYIEGEMLVQVRADANVRDLIGRAPESYEMKLGEYISPPMRIWMIHFNPNQVAHYQIQNWLYEQKEVSVADYNYKIEMRSTIPNDVDFTDQWHHNNTGQTGGTVDADIDSDLAWDITTGGTTATNDDIVVCIIESGNLDHIDLDPNRWFNANEIDGNGVDDDGNGYVDDYHGWNPVSNNDDYGTGGHGTNCLGMIGAKGNNSSLVAGANWDVKLMVVGDYNISSQAEVIEAYTYPLDMRKLWNQSGGTNGAFVVATSSSWGIDGADPANYPLWCAFYDTLGYHGILNVGATTNDNFDVDTGGDMPTGCASPYMIGVGRTDHNDNTAGGYGDQTIEFGAPGINVLTTANTNTTNVVTGTSFSCPLTAGVIGLAYSIPCADFMTVVTYDPKQGADLVLQALLDGTDPKTQLATKFVTGGRLNSRNTLDELMNVACTGSLCLSPSSISVGSITDTTADINFTPYASADESVVYWREVGAPSWTIISNASSPVNLTNLLSCTDYEYYTESVCGTDSSSASSITTFTTTGCGFCIEGGYCASAATDGGDEWIASFEIDSYTNASGNDNGYGDFTASSNISLNLGQTYNFTLTPDWGGTQYDEYTRIWVDIDQDGTFDAGELLFDQGVANQNVVNGSITIPISATVGGTRMRVQMAYLGPGQNTLPNVCGNFTYGEVEDYCLDIIDPNVCNYTVSETITHLNCNGGSDGSITLGNVTGGTSPYTYIWTPGGATSSDINGLTAGNYSVEITDFNSCSSTFNFTVTEPAALSATAIVSNILTGNDGSIDLTGSGGTPNYTYSWNTGETTEDLMNIDSAGTYTCTITDANGCTFQITETVDSELGVGENKLVNINIYPNPSHGLVSIQFDRPITVDVSIYNTIGQRLFTQTNNGQQIFELDASDLATGVYIVNIRTNEGLDINRRITFKK
ncbi:MAG: S8 family serine peptidase [Crocinitomicaceae bacterium]